MLGCPGLPEPGAGRLRICERTKLLVVEINTVSCCSPEAGMAAGCRPAVPWTYRSIAGEYAYLEKRFVAELGPPRPPAEPPAPPGPPWPWVPPDSTSRPPPGCQPWPRGRGPPPGASTPQPAAVVTPGGRLGPPSYEAHMLRVAQTRRPGPPPYVSPPAYNAPHRTLRPPAPRRSPPPRRGPRAPPARWSHTLPRAATEARPRRPPPGWGRSQTLPRAAVARGRQGPRRAPGGHFVIDATRVVIRAEYVPPPRREHVRYLGGSPPARPPASDVPPARPAPGGPGEVAPAAAASSPLGSPRRGVSASPGRRGASGSPRGASCSPGSRGASGSPRGASGSPGRWGGPPYARRPALYAQDLREAVSRIRRHTAPDSDSEAEGRGPRGAGGWRHCREALAYSSSSSSSLEGSGAAACA